jgi:uncharacterized protein YbjT (DUF2867 family)
VLQKNNRKMKIVVTGSLGHISKPMVASLIAAGNSVTVISSTANRVPDIESLGATPAIGSVTDVAFLTSAFTGADAVYTMVPPRWDADNWKEHIHNIGKNYAAAIQAAGVKKVVNLSSVGAHMATGCGPVSGLYGVEAELNLLKDVDVLHLRPGFFYYNLLSNIGLIKHMGIIGGNYGNNTQMVFVHPNDIAAVASDALNSTAFTGKSIRYIYSDERSTHDVAAMLGAAIGNPTLPWVNFTNEEALNGMLQAGLSEEVASNYVEMGAAVASGDMMSDFYKNKPQAGSTKLEDFAKEFATAFVI